MLIHRVVEQINRSNSVKIANQCKYEVMDSAQNSMTLKFWSTVDKIYFAIKYSKVSIK